MYNLAPEPGFTEVFHTKGRGNGYVLTRGRDADLRGRRHGLHGRR